MSNADGSLWVIFNGEVYNYVELREELKGKGHTFRTQCDTEVILESYAEWGIDCLHHFNGMWALALWDNRTRRLFCARDRFGVKPFYYVWDGTTFAFASEIKALLELPWMHREANDDVVYDYLVHRVIDHTDQTFFKGVQQLRPGHYALFTEEGLKIGKYYELAYRSELGTYTEQEADQFAEEFRERFTEAVRLRLRSDVAIGSCLSGGLDSSSVVCTANKLIFEQGQANRDTVGDRQKTFTATYDFPQYSESGFVAKVIERTNAAANNIKPTAAALWDDLPEFLRSNDEPMISTSMYAQWNVMKLASEHGVKVLLDGQGADELLGGYRRWHFPVLHAELLRHARIQEFVRETTAAATVARETTTRQVLFAAQKLLKNLIPGSFHHWFIIPSEFLRPEFRKRASSSVYKHDTSLQRRLWEDGTRYNLQQLLHYEDRNSMYFSIEARVPFLDYMLVEYTMQMPAVYKIHDGWSKFILRKAMMGIVPEEIRWRRDKMGFVTPEAEWEAELMPRILSRLQSERFHSDRFIDGDLLVARLGRPSSGLRSYDAWRLINLELWMRIFDVS
jgi:asparagine synthase (glutamine-hydrolysing)